MCRTLKPLLRAFRHDDPYRHGILLKGVRSRVLAVDVKTSSQVLGSGGHFLFRHYHI